MSTSPRCFTGELTVLVSFGRFGIRLMDSFKNEYGVQVKQPARPTFPVEYLFVNVSLPSEAAA